MDSLKHWIIKHRSLVAAVFAVAILLSLFSSILEDVYEKDSRILQADVNIASYITSVREPILNNFFLAVTQLGNPIPLTISFIAILVIFFAYKKYNQLAIIFLTLAGSSVITYVIKNIVQRARPLNGLVVEHGFSFPSGHAFIAVCFWAVLFYLLATLTKNVWLKVALITFGIFIALLIGFSRVYIGVHWPSDVTASFLLATAYSVSVIYIINRGTKYLQNKKI